jgi:hypothetical protein
METDNDKPEVKLERSRLTRQVNKLNRFSPMEIKILQELPAYLYRPLAKK